LEDATALQFSEIRVGVCYTENIGELAQSYYDLYFGDYEEMIPKKINVMKSILAKNSIKVSLLKVKTLSNI
jgi:hypothetical protein